MCVVSSFASYPCSFPYLQRQLATTVLRFVRSGFQPATQMVRSLVDCEADYINTDHPDFIGGRGAMRSVWQDKAAAAARTGRKVRDFAEAQDAAACGDNVVDRADYVWSLDIVYAYVMYVHGLEGWLLANVTGW